MNEFAKTFRELIKQSGKSIPMIAEDSDVDVAYIRKLASGEKRRPKPIIVAKLMIGLVADRSLVKREPMLVQHGLGQLIDAMLSDALAGDHLK